MPAAPPDRVALVLVGHGAPATDCPPELIGELMGLEWRKGAGGPPSPELQRRAEALDGKIRNWPRHAGNDPYKRGLEQLADLLRPLVPAELFAIAYNEFCRPSLTEAVEAIIRQGATRILVIPSMLTPGGVHAERDIPQELDGLRRRHPGVGMQYLWPFDLQQVAELFAAHVRAALGQRAAITPG